jgi:hypothetical protein
VVDKRALIADQIALAHAAAPELLQRTIVTLYTAIGPLVGASLTVGLSASTKWALGWIPVVFGLSGAFALLIAAGTLDPRGAAGRPRRAGRDRLRAQDRDAQDDRAAVAHREARRRAGGRVARTGARG